MTVVLADLQWLARARSPGARIVAIHWDHGLMALETRGGDAPPVATTEREVVRAPRQAQPGVWLWGIRRREGAAFAVGMRADGP
jgi:hypothetical protein